MNTAYDTAAWAADTTLGRRVFNVNFRLTGKEMSGWTLVNESEDEIEPGITEHVYMLQQARSKQEALIRVGVTELDSWRQAQQRLQSSLQHCMRPDIPRGEGGLAKLGDILYSNPVDSRAPVTSALFTRGNLLITITSVGDKPVDVAALAKKIDADLSSEPPKAKVAAQSAATAGLAATTRKLPETKKGHTAEVITDLSQTAQASGWIKVIAPQGELQRVNDRLVHIPDESGKTQVKLFSLPHLPPAR